VQSWRSPQVPSVPGSGPVPRLFDSATGQTQPAEASGVASLYVCGITPYDATHLGHAATYLAYDTLVRLWRDAGYEVRYVQNVTDVDDPLLERAATMGVDWRDLAAQQVELFRGDMEALSIVPPDRYIAVTEVVDEIAGAVDRLHSAGVAYHVESPDADADIYFDIAAAERSSAWRLGQESRLHRPEMLELSAQRGGDPDRAGKRDPLDPLLWRAERAGEPSWPSPVGAGRPGWHIECAAIALKFLPHPVTVNGGGSDLLFPHHEFSAAHAVALAGHPFAGIYSHAGMVAFEGEKMSKSLGNLVLVSSLVAAGVDPAALRLALLSQHYRSDWEWTDALLDAARATLASWRTWAAAGTIYRAEEPARPDDAARVIGSAPSVSLVERLRAALQDDLDTPAAIAVVDAAIAAHEAASAESIATVHALLGIDLLVG
jgi:L-cysteine:1D-myo-inositol 2-amino-2-deoxy-alpha-D-glucopyranoside ligase